VPFSLTLTVEDAYGNVVPSYAGTVHFSGGTTRETLPPDYTFTAADAGVHTFTNAFVLFPPKRGPQGPWTIQATDTQNSNLTGQVWLYF
jgi:adhesin/invasin